MEDAAIASANVQDPTRRVSFSKGSSRRMVEEDYIRYQNVVSASIVGGFLGVLKRGIDGIYRHAGKLDLHCHSAEFDFRYNAREVTDVKRRDFCIKQVGGKRLTYRDPCGKRTEESPF